MALVLNDRVKETSTTTGQGTLDLAGAATGFETFVTGIGDTNTTYYGIVHATDGTWELGIGTVTDASPDTLARTTVIDTSAGNTTKIDFATGTKNVFCTLPSSKAVFLDADGDVTLGANLDVGGNLTVTGTTTFNGGTLTLGDANTDNIVFGGEVDSDIIPDDDGTFDLGSSSKEWQDLFIDGTANIDSLVADTADINGGTIDGAVIGGASAAAITGTAITGTSFVIGSADINEAELETIDGVTAGTVAASKAVVVDSNKDISSFRNVTATTFIGNVDAVDGDFDGTLEADAITVAGTALSSVIAGTTVANATLAATVTVTDSTANTNFPVVFHDESNALLDDTGALRYNPSTGELLVPKLTVAGTTTTVDTVTMNASNAIIFEGATADAHETTLTIVDPTGDRTINLPNVSGTIPVLAAVSATQITSTPEELNLLDGITAGTVSASLAVIVDSNKDITGFRNITLTGELDAATLDISGNADIDGTLEADAITIGGVSTDTLYASPGFAVAMAIAL